MAGGTLPTTARKPELAAWRVRAEAGAVCGWSTSCGFVKSTPAVVEAGAGRGAAGAWLCGAVTVTAVLAQMLTSSTHQGSWLELGWPFSCTCVVPSGIGVK